MLKNYEAIWAGNVGCLQFLVDLTGGPISNNVKAFHYLSTWGVPSDVACLPDRRGGNGQHETRT
jgi:hypothetical protein